MKIVSSWKLHLRCLTGFGLHFCVMSHHVDPSCRSSLQILYSKLLWRQIFKCHWRFVDVFYPWRNFHSVLALKLCSLKCYVWVGQTFAKEFHTFYQVLAVNFCYHRVYVRTVLTAGGNIWRCWIKNVIKDFPILKNNAKFTVRYLWRSPLFEKVAASRRITFIEKRFRMDIFLGIFQNL